MKSQKATSALKASGRKRTQRNKQKNKAVASPQLQDLFVQDEELREQRHILENHLEKMKAMEEMHQAQLRAIREQLHISLFKIWNEMWLQKKATQAKAHKEWLKVLAA